MNHFFHNATDFETKNILRLKIWIEFPHSVRTWIKIFTTHQILFKKLFLESQELLENSPSKNQLVGQFTPQKRQSWLFCPILERLFRKKLFLIINRFESKQFLNHFLYNASFFESRVSNASNLQPFYHNSTNFESKSLERVLFRKKNDTASELEVELLMCTKTDFVESFAFRKKIFGSFQPVKTPNFATMRFLKNNQLVKRMEEKPVSYQDFWKESDFEKSF